MPDDFDFISATDKPALLAFSTPEWLETAKAALQELGYKVHTAGTHSGVFIHFTHFRYQIVILEELFAANSIAETTTLQTPAKIPSNQRGQSTTILFGPWF